MKNHRTHKTLWVVGAIVALGGIGAGAWWVGMTQGMAMMAAPEAVAQASDDPSQWSIPQGEEATRRHIRDGIKAGEVVSTGTCTGVTPIAPGQTLVADFGDLGRVEVRFIAG